MDKKIFEMPKLTEDMEAGRIVAWLIEPGESFKKGQDIIEVETDKVISVLQAVEDGVLISQLVAEGDKVEVGASLGEWE